MPADAVIDGDYRYALWRGDAPYVLWVMLNPSTADAQTDDPTIRKCMKYALSWGHKGIMVVNLFAFRATDPAELLTAKDPVGPHNDFNIIGMLRATTTALRESRWNGSTFYLGEMHPLVMCAWGGKVPKAHAERPQQVRQLISAYATPGVLEINADGSPKHPLYCKDELKPTRWA